MDAANKIGEVLFKDEWLGSELKSKNVTGDAKARSDEVYRHIRNIIRDGRIKVWSVDKRNDRWLLERDVATDPQFQIDLSKGLICGIWGPDSLSGCVFDLDEFHAHLGENRPKRKAGRKAEYNWEAIVHEGWRKTFQDGFSSVEELSEHLAQWCEDEFQRQPDISEIRKRVRKIRDDAIG